MSDTLSHGALGLDVGGTNIRAVVGSPQAVMVLPSTPLPKNYAAFVEQVEVFLRAASERAAVPITAICLGLPGIVEGDRASWVPNAPYLNEKPLAAELKQRLGIPVQLGNDAQLALLGEVWKGVGQGRRSALLMSIGTGIGGALMVNGKIVRGAHGSAGAFGWLTLGVDEAGSPDYGYLERVASGKALEYLGHQLIPPRSSFEVVEGARKGDKGCLEVVDGIGALLGLALAGLTSAFDPEIMIISGGVSEAFDVFEAPIRANLLRFASPNGRQVPITVGALKAQAGAYGALHAAYKGGGVFI